MPGLEGARHGEHASLRGTRRVHNCGRHRLRRSRFAGLEMGLVGDTSDVRCHILTPAKIGKHRAGLETVISAFAGDCRPRRD